MKLRAWYVPRQSVDLLAERTLVGEWTLSPLASGPEAGGKLFMGKAAVTLPDGAQFELIATGNADRGRNSYLLQGINRADDVLVQGSAEQRLLLRITTGRGGTLQVEVGEVGGEFGEPDGLTNPLGDGGSGR